VIRITGLEKRFGRLEVLRGVDLEVRPGRVTGLWGPNASGKSTLIRVVLGLVRPDRGEVRLDGALLGRDWRYRSRIGYMAQRPPFPDNLTGAELLAMLRELRGGGAAVDEGLLEAFRLADELHKPLRSLSGGTRQKLNAALAFHFTPDLLILDEPTAGLDPLASTILKDEVRRARGAGRTVLLISHQMSDVEELADDFVLLLEGRVRWVGPAAEILQRTGQTSLERAVARMLREGVAA
jgi:Cu-processing system ATP-binding protein